MGRFAQVFRAAVDADLLRGDRGWTSVGSVGPFVAGASTASGRTVTFDNALRNSAVWRAVVLKSSLLGMFPCRVYQELPNGSRRLASEHPNTRLLHWRPNPWQTPYQFRAMVEGHRITRGNAYVAIIRDRGGTVRSLVPLHPDRVRVVTDDQGMPRYDVAMRTGERPVRLGWMECLHLTGPSLEGFIGLSPIEHAAEAIGIAQAGEEYAARVYSSGGAQRGALVHKGPALSDAAKARLKEAWQAAYGPNSEAHRVAVLEEDLDWKTLGVTPEQAQSLESRQHQVIDIGRYWGIPPWLLFEHSKDTSWGSGIEQTNQAFLLYCMQPDLINWEQRMLLDLFDESEIEAGYYPEFTVEVLLRGDMAARGAFYRVMREIGAYSVDDILAKENLPLVGGAGGSERCRPANWVPIGTPAGAGGDNE